MTFELKPLSCNVLTADSNLEGSVITTRFKGTADVEARVDLDDYVNRLFEEARRVKANKVIVDLRELEFMNSSCFKIFVRWLARVQELPADEQYRLHIISNPQMHWQRRSLAALSCFAVDLVTIET